MLDQNDLQAIRAIMKEINTVKENLEELKQYYRITKLENDE